MFAIRIATGSFAPEVIRIEQQQDYAVMIEYFDTDGNVEYAEYIEVRSPHWEDAMYVLDWLATMGWCGGSDGARFYAIPEEEQFLWENKAREALAVELEAKKEREAVLAWEVEYGW